MHWKNEFPLRDGLIYLNHAAVGVWPRKTCEAVKAFAEENMRQGAADYPRWLDIERELRGRLQRLVNAVSRDDIALVKNTSEGLSLLAYGLDWRPDDNIVSTNREFPSNRMVWESLKGRGVNLYLADLDNDDPESAILALCDTNTRLLTVSSVQYASGLRLHLKRLGAFCRDNGIIFCVDAIQSLGALRFDAQACHADVVVADGHKWMLGSEGLALFYIRSELRDQLKLSQFGWHMVEQAGDFDRHDWQAAKSARRFEPGSLNMLGIHALNASLSLLEEVGMREIERCVLDRARVLMRMLEQAPGTELLTPREPDRFAGIVNVRFRGINRAGHEYIHSQLMQQRVICAFRGGGIRFSPHFYVSDAYLEEAVRIVTRLSTAS